MTKKITTRKKKASPATAPEIVSVIAPEATPEPATEPLPEPAPEPLPEPAPEPTTEPAPAPEAPVEMPQPKKSKLGWFARFFK